MARYISDREDLLRDGSQMPIRGRTSVRGQEFFIGFRSAGQASLYCDQDPVFQFNAKYELRRVFFDGERYAAYSGQLYCLKQMEVHSEGAKIGRLKLIQVPTSSEAVKTIVNEFHRIQSLLISQDLVWEFIGVDSTTDFALLIGAFLKKAGDPLVIAESPSA